MKVHIESVPHDSQEYDTVGNYKQTSNGLKVTISDTGNPDYTFLVAIHELVEAYLAIKHQIDYSDIDRYDLAYEGDGEPGDDLKAPYHDEHKAATEIEKKVAELLDVDWEEYDKKLNSLEYKKTK